MQTMKPTCLSPLHQRGSEGKNTLETSTTGVLCKCLEAADRGTPTEGSNQVPCLTNPVSVSPRPRFTGLGAALLHLQVRPYRSSLCVS